MSTQLPDPPTFAYEPDEWENRLYGWPLALAWVAVFVVSWTIAIGLVWVAIRLVRIVLVVIGGWLQ